MQVAKPQPAAYGLDADSGERRDFFDGRGLAGGVGGGEDRLDRGELGCRRRAAAGVQGEGQATADLARKRLPSCEHERIDARRRWTPTRFGERGDRVAAATPLNHAMPPAPRFSQDDGLQQAEVTDQLVELDARVGVRESVDPVQRHALVAKPQCGHR
jgi:hypothetical protein